MSNNESNYTDYIDFMLSETSGVYTSDEDESKFLTETDYNNSYYTIFYNDYNSYIISKFTLLAYDI